MDKNLIAVLAVALLTWGGVFFYLLRLEAMTRGLERHLQTLKVEASDAASEVAPREHLNV